MSGPGEDADLDTALAWFREPPTRAEMYSILTAQSAATGQLINALSALTIERRHEAVENLQTAVEQLQNVLRDLPHISERVSEELAKALDSDG